MPKPFIVIEPAPEKGGSIKHFHNWINDVEKAIDDSKDLWKLLDSDIVKAVNYEFSEANPNSWKQLSQAYFTEKTAKGFPETIGVRTGSLKRAAAEDAIREYGKGVLGWAVNNNVTAGAFGSLKNLRTGDYAEEFNELRPIFVYSVDHIKREGSKAVEKYVQSITEEY
jgi:hypothetical protein